VTPVVGNIHNSHIFFVFCFVSELGVRAVQTTEKPTDGRLRSIMPKRSTRMAA